MNNRARMWKRPAVPHGLMHPRPCRACHALQSGCLLDACRVTDPGSPLDTNRVAHAHNESAAAHTHLFLPGDLQKTAVFILN